MRSFEAGIPRNSIKQLIARILRFTGARFVTLDQITLIEKQIIVSDIRIQREKLASSIEIG